MTKKGFRPNNGSGQRSVSSGSGDAGAGPGPNTGQSAVPPSVDTGPRAPAHEDPPTPALSNLPGLPPSSVATSDSPESETAADQSPEQARRSDSDVEDLRVRMDAIELGFKNTNNSVRDLISVVDRLAKASEAATAANPRQSDSVLEAIEQLQLRIVTMESKAEESRRDSNSSFRLLRSKIQDLEESPAMNLGPRPSSVVDAYPSEGARVNPVGEDRGRPSETLDEVRPTAMPRRARTVDADQGRDRRNVTVTEGGDDDRSFVGEKVKSSECPQFDLSKADTSIFDLEGFVWQHPKMGAKQFASVATGRAANDYSRFYLVEFFDRNSDLTSPSNLVQRLKSAVVIKDETRARELIYLRIKEFFGKRVDSDFFISTFESKVRCLWEEVKNFIEPIAFQNRVLTVFNAELAWDLSRGIPDRVGVEMWLKMFAETLRGYRKFAAQTTLTEKVTAISEERWISLNHYSGISSLSASTNGSSLPAVTATPGGASLPSAQTAGAPASFHLRQPRGPVSRLVCLLCEDRVNSHRASECPHLRTYIAQPGSVLTVEGGSVRWKNADGSAGDTVPTGWFAGLRPFVLPKGSPASVELISVNFTSFHELGDAYYEKGFENGADSGDYVAPRDHGHTVDVRMARVVGDESDQRVYIVNGVEYTDPEVGSISKEEAEAACAAIMTKSGTSKQAVMVSVVDICRTVAEVWATKRTAEDDSDDQQSKRARTDEWTVAWPPAPGAAFTPAHRREGTQNSQQARPLQRPPLRRPVSSPSLAGRGPPSAALGGKPVDFGDGVTRSSPSTEGTTKKPESGEKKVRFKRFSPAEAGASNATDLITSSIMDSMISIKLSDLVSVSPRLSDRLKAFTTKVRGDTTPVNKTATSQLKAAAASVAQVISELEEGTEEVDYSEDQVAEVRRLDLIDPSVRLTEQAAEVLKVDLGAELGPRSKWTDALVAPTPELCDVYVGTEREGIKFQRAALDEGSMINLWSLSHARKLQHIYPIRDGEKMFMRGASGDVKPLAGYQVLPISYGGMTWVTPVYIRDDSQDIRSGVEAPFPLLLGVPFHIASRMKSHYDDRGSRWSELASHEGKDSLIVKTVSGEDPRWKWK